MLDQGHGVVNNLTPLLLLFVPDYVSGFLPVRQAVVAPNVFDIVEVAHLRKGAQEGFSVFVVAKADGFGAVVAPLNHGTRFEVVGSKLVEVSTTVRHFLPHAHLGPIAESRSNILRMYH